MAAAGVSAPQQLVDVTSQAEKRYGLPPGILVGIWSIETGRSYPNPYANGLGYGGEFGTAVTAPFGPASAQKRIVEPPLQQQANTAASILSRLIRQNNGDVSKALSQYSGGGYSTVPGLSSTYVSLGPSADPNAGSEGKVNLGPGTPVPALTGWVSDLLSIAKQYALRVAQVVGGGILIVVGLFLLVRGRAPAPVAGVL